MGTTRNRNMATTSTRKLEDSQKLASPRFIKAVIRPLVQGMPIPIVFMQRYGDSLHKNVILSLPDGSKWQVALRNIDGETWMGKGLKEFGDFYSIKEGYVLVFQYKGNSKFDVLIFNHTASEINYLNCEEKINGCPVRTKVDGNIRIKRETVGDFDHYETTNQGSSSRVANSGRLRRKITSARRGKGTSGAPHQFSMATKATNVVKKEQITEDERVPKFQYPSFSFVVRRFHLTHLINVPIGFARKNFGDDGDCKLMYKLRQPESSANKTWRVRVSMTGRRATITGSGWVLFTKQNRLKLGEICIVEMVKNKKLVNVYRRG